MFQGHQSTSHFFTNTIFVTGVTESLIDINHYYAKSLIIKLSVHTIAIRFLRCASTQHLMGHVHKIPKNAIFDFQELLFLTGNSKIIHCSSETSPIKSVSHCSVAQPTDYIRCPIYQILTYLFVIVWSCTLLDQG